MKKARVLVVDDENIIAWTLQEKLIKEGFEVRTVENGESAINSIKEDMPDLAFVDVFLPDIGGIQVLKEIISLNEEIPVIMVTGSGSVDTAVTAMKLGAYDYINKPFNLTEVAIIAKKAIESKRVSREVSWRLEKEKKTHSIGNIIGESKEIKGVLDMIQKIVQSDATTVLIEGESGTGKDLVGRAIHYTSRRSARPFMDINCTALPDTLVESELFGYEKGAFTDAKAKKVGLFELADGGSVLLDEIGDMPLTTQTKLLKFIENKRFKRVGGASDIEVDVRIIAATNKNLKEEIKSGKFREDLYYRLKVIPIFIPPLRVRTGDILILANYFINKFNQEFRKDVKGLSSKAEKAILLYQWPGNVRELKNVIERAIILESKDQILIEHLPIEVVEGVPFKEEERQQQSNFILPENGVPLEEVEKNLLIQALKKANGNQSKAAKLLSLSRYALRYRLKKIGYLKSDTADSDIKQPI
ncbi:MAG: Fis family transcriptional regulator [Nitrospinae bacterium RIFCSPLOWO2_01_FULL_39_10]|nr:MAG: Fis family transcriptional regulator [Nitrospinae bacterium RIFCSPLOWO2_01_FULL_39_10]